LALRNRDKSRGSTLVESAVSLLLLLTLVFGIIEFGHLFNVYQVMTNASREGARFAAAPCPFTSSIGSTCVAGQLPSTSAVQNYVQSFLNSGNVYGATVTPATINQTLNGVTLSYTQVTVSSPFTFYFFNYTPTLTTNAVMRNETN
jgi:Flp pilus assembly protein TadG